MGRLSIGRGADQVDGGRMTRSMTWMTPFDVSILGVTTLASLIFTEPEFSEIYTIAPLTVLASLNCVTFSAITAPGTT